MRPSSPMPRPSPRRIRRCCACTWGTAARFPAAATAVGSRTAQYVLNMQGAWETPAEDDIHIAWARTWSAMRPFSSGGTYVNFLTQDADEERVRAAYGPELYDRLARVKAKYDPGNLFRSNQEHRPARGRLIRRVLARRRGSARIGKTLRRRGSSRASVTAGLARSPPCSGVVDIPPSRSSPASELRIGLRAWRHGRRCRSPCVPGHDAGVP